MARASRSGVTGLSRVASGRHSGRYQLDFRRLDPATGRLARVTKRYPADWPAVRVKRDASQIIDAVIAGTWKVKPPAPEVRHTIRSLAVQVVAVYETKDLAPATHHEFRSVVCGTASKPEARAGHVVRLLGALCPHELTRSVLAGFVDALTAEGLAPLTVRNVVKALGMFLKIVRVRELDPKLTCNPVRDAFEAGLELPSKRRAAPIFLTSEDASKLLSTAPEPRRTRYAAALLSGLRDGELAGLTWGDVDLSAGLLHVRRACALRGGVRQTKTLASTRSVPIHPDLAWRLRGLAVADSAAPVFARNGKTHRPDSARLLRADLASAGVVLEGATFHALRRSFATWLEAAGVGHETIERLMGHEPRSVLGRHYAATSLAVLREAIDRIAIPGTGPLRAVASA